MEKREIFDVLFDLSYFHQLIINELKDVNKENIEYIEDLDKKFSKAISRLYSECRQKYNV